jgi:hypothetical protein
MHLLGQFSHRSVEVLLDLFLGRLDLLGPTCCLRYLDDEVVCLHSRSLLSWISCSNPESRPLHHLGHEHQYDEGTCPRDGSEIQTAED